MRFSCSRTSSPTASNTARKARACRARSAPEASGRPAVRLTRRSMSRSHRSFTTQPAARMTMLPRANSRTSRSVSRPRPGKQDAPQPWQEQQPGADRPVQPRQQQVWPPTGWQPSHPTFRGNVGMRSHAAILRCGDAMRKRRPGIPAILILGGPAAVSPRCHGLRRQATHVFTCVRRSEAVDADLCRHDEECGAGPSPDSFIVGRRLIPRQGLPRQAAHEVQQVNLGGRLFQHLPDAKFRRTGHDRR